MLQESQGGGGCDPESPECGPRRLTTLLYDYRNQMVVYENTMGGEFATMRFQYDALGRRVSRTRTPVFAGQPDTVTAYVNGWQASWQVLAEYDGVTVGANLAATYIYGNYIQMSRDFDGSRSGTVQNFFYHQDDLFNVIALTAGTGSAAGGGVSIPVEEGQPLPFAAGAIVERVQYGDYGSPDLRSATGGKAGTASIARNAYLFTGRDWDHETRLYYYRTRYMEPTWGRFTTRDSIGTWGDIGNSGNALNMVTSNPCVFADPFGRAATEPPLLVPIPLDFREGEDSEGNPLRFTDEQKEQFKKGMQAACNRAQCALEALNNPTSSKTAKASCDANKIDPDGLIKRLNEYIGRFCSGTKGGKSLPIVPYFDNPPPGNKPSPKTIPKDDDRPIKFPLYPGTKQFPKRDFAEDLIHEPFHRLFDTRDDDKLWHDWNEHPNLNQHRIDGAIKAACNRGKHGFGIYPMDRETEHLVP